MLNKLNKKLSLTKDSLLIYLLLLAASSITPILVSRKFVAIHDLAYFLTNGLRISQGQFPYVDFITVHSPGSFYIISNFINLFGNTYLPIYLWMYFVNFISTLCIYNILKRLYVSNRFLISVLFGILGPYSFFSQIWYDSDSLFFLIISVYLLFYLKESNTNRFLFFLTGVVSFLPYFVKQNIGLVTIVIVNLLFLFIYETRTINKFYFFFGQLFSIFSYFLFLYLNNAIESWYKYSFKYAVLSRHRSIIPDIFPIKFIEKYNFIFQFENLYYILYFLVVIFGSLALLKQIEEIKFRIILSELLILIFCGILFFDKLVLNELINFISKFDIFKFLFFNDNFLLSIFFILTALNLLISNISIKTYYLEKYFLYILNSIILWISFTYFVSMFQGKNLKDFANISFKYNLLFLFFLTFPIVLYSLKISLEVEKKYYLFVIPMLAYLYSTSLSQGVAGSLSAGTGILIVLFFIILSTFKESKIKQFTNYSIYLLSLALFVTAVFGSRYHFIKFENLESRFNEFTYMTLPSSHYKQQDYALDIIKNYSNDYEKIIFVPEATTAYFTANYYLKADVHTFDYVTNPYSFKYDIYSIKHFLECNSIDLVVVNKNNHRVYFDEFTTEKNLDHYLGPNYKLKDRYYDFLIYIRFEVQSFNQELCNL